MVLAHSDVHVSSPVGCVDASGIPERVKEADPNLIVKVCTLYCCSYV